MSRVRTFRAETMQQALEIVRDEMGANAVILHTKQVAQKRLLPWGKPKELVEITAGLEVDIPSAAERIANRERRTARQQQQQQNQQQKRSSLPVQQQPSRSQQSPAPTRLNFTTPEEPLTLQRPQPIKPKIPQAEEQNKNPQQNKREQHKRQQVEKPVARKTETPPNAQPKKRRLPENDQFTEFAQRLDGIEKMLANLSRFSQLPLVDNLPGELFNLYTELKTAHVSDEIAREIVFRMQDHCSVQQLEDVAATKALLTAMLESELNCKGSIIPVKGERKVVALVGPTGVGKTTTIAKLAANFQLREGLRVGLVTVDTYRIAAVDQLKTYAEIIDLPMQVVTNPFEMRRALDEMAGLDLILVDTAGRSPHDDLRIQELEHLIAGTGIDEVHLVMSGASSIDNWETTLDKFSTAGISSIVLTKLDEMQGLGPLLSLSRKTDLPISYLTTGQDVPEDIEPAETTRLTQLILGEQSLRKKSPHVGRVHNG